MALYNCAVLILYGSIIWEMLWIQQLLIYGGLRNSEIIGICMWKDAEMKFPHAGDVLHGTMNLRKKFREWEIRMKADKGIEFIEEKHS